MGVAAAMNRPVLQKEVSIPAAAKAEWKRLADFSARDIADWRDLCARALEPNVFLEPDFALAADAMTGERTGAVLVRVHGRLAGLFPGDVEGISSGRAVHTFVSWTHPFAPLSAPLVDRDSALGVIEAFLAFLPSLPETPAVALLPLVNEGGAFARAMGEALIASGTMVRRFGTHERAAFSGADGNALSARKLKELRRQRRRLEEEGALVFETVREPARVAAAMGEYLALEAKGWKGRNGSAAQSDPVVERFLCEAVHALGAQGKARLDFLRMNGVAIAAAITLFSGDRGWFWKISYDEGFARFSPGVQLTFELTESLRRCTSIALVDSCAAADHPMIDHVWARRIPLADWLIPLAGPASFAACIVFESARRFSISTLKAARNLVR